MSEKVVLQRFSPYNSGDARHFGQLIKCYRDVFSGEPWNEWKKCQVCGLKWGFGQEEELRRMDFTHCRQAVSDFWTEQEVRGDISKEVVQHTSCWLAVCDGNCDQVVGFCWGYPIEPEVLEGKIALSGVAAEIRKEFGNVPKISYHDEIGVAQDFRGRKIAKAMFSNFVSDMLIQDLDIGIVRTKTNPPTVAFSWFMKLGFKVIARYDDADQRVILAASYKKIII